MLRGFPVLFHGVSPFHSREFPVRMNTRLLQYLLLQKYRVPKKYLIFTLLFRERSFSRYRLGIRIGWSWCYMHTTDTFCLLPVVWRSLSNVEVRTYLWRPSARTIQPVGLDANHLPRQRLRVKFFGNVVFYVSKNIFGHSLASPMTSCMSNQRFFIMRLRARSMVVDLLECDYKVWKSNCIIYELPGTARGPA
jgi:hypothetical protein